MKKKKKKQLKKGEKRNQKEAAKSSSSLYVQFMLIGFLLLGVGYQISVASPANNSHGSISSKAVDQEGLNANLSIHNDDFPAATPIVHKNGYTFAYDGKSRVPLWIYEHVESSRFSDVGKKMKMRFQEDTSIAKHLRASNIDYLKSGYVQGLLSSIQYQGTAKESKDALLLSNASPLSPNFPKRMWDSLERMIRDMSFSAKDVYVVTGILFMPCEYEDGNRYVQYRVIGDHDVAVPTHFYKVILSESYSGEYEMSAYIIPNEAIPEDKELAQFKTTVEDVEKYSGLTFFNKLDKDVAMNLKLAL